MTGLGAISRRSHCKTATNGPKWLIFLSLVLERTDSPCLKEIPA